MQTWSTQNLTMTIARDEYPSYPMVLRGINQKATFPQYQPAIMLEKGYTIHWNGPAPRTAFLYLINFNRYVSVTVTSHKGAEAWRRMMPCCFPRKGRTPGFTWSLYISC